MRTLGLALLLTLAAGAPARAQDCTVVQNRTVTVSNRDTPNEVAYVVGADIVCPGGRRILTDYATIFRATGVVDMRGNVRFTDPERALSSDQAQYDRVNQRLYASGNVRVRDLRTGSTLRSDNLNYLQGTPTREALMQAQPGARRPQAVLRNPRRNAARRDSTVVDADMIEVRGERFFHAVGNAILTRDSLRATGGLIDYDQDTGALLVAHSARVVGSQYQLTGDSVRAAVAGDTLRSVHARRNARLTTRDVQVDAPGIDIGLNDGQVERMIAVLLPDVPAGTRARVVAETFRLAADSIEVRAPGQQIEEVIAVGTAFGEMLDTLPATPLPEEVLTQLGNDWMRGDTLRAFFAANPRAATDTTADARVLERLVALGAPASALYRQRPARAAATVVDSAGVVTETPPEIGYILARTIEVRLVEGEVRDVDAAGEVRGMYLQPRARASTVGQGTGRQP